MTMHRVAVIGAGGRMGAITCAAFEAEEDLDLVARVGRGDPLEAVTEAGAEVAVEFTTPASVKVNAEWLLTHGVHAVVGATGLGEGDLADLEARTGPANCLVAPNFAIGAVLLMRLAAEVARHLPHVEITELHHDRKVDAPSGTALRTARQVAAARAEAVAVPGPADTPARGLVVEGVPVHSVRLPGLVASQEVVFGGPGQTLTLRHDSIDRTSFMPGVLLAVRRIAEFPGLTVGLEALLK
ncbi:MAG: 4-hydroxy-tetrahydrodipicolinate reductase [Nitriliruptorales bacterium]|nr:4-hydroxy-tetrahydrodipicolinate reductase [Nitriliruptorales bacterium]